MARTLSPALAKVLGLPDRSTRCQVDVRGPDGAWVNLSDLHGRDWVDGASGSWTVDAPVADFSVRLRPVVDGMALSALVEDSRVNRDASGAYAPLIDGLRGVRVRTDVAPEGADAAQWATYVEGEILAPDFASGTLQCAGLGVALQRKLIETERTYGSDAGVAVTTVLQQMLDDNLGVGAVTLFVREDPAVNVRAFIQERVPLLGALRDQVLRFGYDVRYLWDNGTSTFRLTLYRPARAKAAPDWTLGPDEYLEVSELKVDPTGVRNVIQVWYTDAATGERRMVERTDPDSIARYGRQIAQIEEGDGSQIDTATEAGTLADTVLSDLKDGFTTHRGSLHFHPGVEVGDLIRIPATEGLHDRALDLAVVGASWEISAERHRLNLDLRGKPSGGYATWLARTTPFRPGGPDVNPSVDPRFALSNVHVVPAQSTATHHAIGWDQGAGVVEVWGAAQVFDASIDSQAMRDTLIAASAPVTEPLMVPKGRQGQLSGFWLQPVAFHATTGASLDLGGLFDTFAPPPEEPPVFAVLTKEGTSNGTALITLQQRGVKVTALRVRTQVGDEQPSAWREPFRTTGATSVVKGGTLAADQWEHDVALHQTRFSRIEAEADLDTGETVTIPVPPFDRNTAPAILSLDIIDLKAKCSGDSDTKSWRAYRKDVPSTDPGYWENSIDGSYVTFSPPVPADTRWEVEFQARNDVTAAVSASTQIVSESRMVGTKSSTAPAWSKVALEPPVVGSRVAKISLQAVNLPADLTGWSVTLDARVDTGSGFGSWASITADVTPAPAPSNNLTTHDWATEHTHTSDGALLVTYEVRARLLEGTTVRDSAASAAGWQYGTASGSTEIQVVA